MESVKEGLEANDRKRTQTSATTEMTPANARVDDIMPKKEIPEETQPSRGIPPLDLDEEDTQRGGTTPGGGLGGNRLTDMSTPPGYVTEDDLTPGERRRGGESVLPKERHPQD